MCEGAWVNRRAEDSPFDAGWLALGERVGSNDPEIWKALGTRLRTRHEEPHRRYHGVDHVEAVLSHLRDLAPDITGAERAVLELAAFYHDAVYDPAAEGNEARSAALLTHELRGLVPTELTTAAAAIVEATASHDSTGDPVADTFLDADLAILGAGAEVYDTYAAAIRDEYGHLDDDVFRSGRGSFLEAFIARPIIFLTVAGRDRFEEAARANLRRELEALTS